MSHEFRNPGHQEPVEPVTPSSSGEAPTSSTPPLRPEQLSTARRSAGAEGAASSDTSTTGAGADGQSRDLSVHDTLRPPAPPDTVGRAILRLSQGRPGINEALLRSSDRSVPGTPRLTEALQRLGLEASDVIPTARQDEQPTASDEPTPGEPGQPNSGTAETSQPIAADTGSQDPGAMTPGSPNMRGLFDSGTFDERLLRSDLTAEQRRDARLQVARLRATEETRNPFEVVMNAGSSAPGESDQPATDEFEPDTRDKKPYENPVPGMDVRFGLDPNARPIDGSDGPSGDESTAPQPLPEPTPEGGDDAAHDPSDDTFRVHDTVNWGGIIMTTGTRIPEGASGGGRGPTDPPEHETAQGDAGDDEGGEFSLTDSDVDDLLGRAPDAYGSTVTGEHGTHTSLDGSGIEYYNDPDGAPPVHIENIQPGDRRVFEGGREIHIGPRLEPGQPDDNGNIIHGGSVTIRGSSGSVVIGNGIVSGWNWNATPAEPEPSDTPGFERMSPEQYREKFNEEPLSWQSTGLDDATRQNMARYEEAYRERYGAYPAVVPPHMTLPPEHELDGTDQPHPEDEQ